MYLMEESKINSLNWFALYTKPRSEFKAKAQLDEVEIINYLPTVIRVRKWSDRKKKIEEPLFKSYIFIKATEKQRVTAIQKDAIVRIICFSGKPSMIPEWQILNLQKLLEETKEVDVIQGLVTGQKVKIIEGPFEGVEGVINFVSKNKLQLAVNVDLLFRSVVVNLPAESVVKSV